MPLSIKVPILFHLNAMKSKSRWNHILSTIRRLNGNCHSWWIFRFWDLLHILFIRSSIWIMKYAYWARNEIQEYWDKKIGATEPLPTFAIFLWALRFLPLIHNACVKKKVWVYTRIWWWGWWVNDLGDVCKGCALI